MLVFAVLYDILNLNPEELNVGFTKTLIVHAPIQAKSMPISTSGSCR
jgi:hypothetical protein